MRADEIVSALQDGSTFCAECPHYGEPNGCNRPSGDCVAWSLGQEAADLIKSLQTENERLARHGGEYMRIADERYKMYEKAARRAEESEIQLAKRDKELERIKTAVAEKGGTEDYPTEDAYLTACEALAKAHKEIERLREARGWISVEEKLPEEAYGCLLIVEADNYWGEPRKVLLPYFAGYDGDRWNDGDGEQVPFEVTHWMPLPEPPKEGAEK